MLKSEAQYLKLAPFLDELYSTYHRKEHLNSDPLEFVHQFQDPWDQEVVALIAALLAYGNVKQVRKSVSDVLQRISRIASSPSELVRKLSLQPAKGDLFHQKLSLEFRSFVHRFNRGPDLVLLLQLLSESWRRYGSLGGHFLGNLENGAPESTNIECALSILIADWKRWAGKRGNRSFQYLLTSPGDGSCCKRWCMFLRWMGRKDGLDLGLWTEGSGASESYLSTFPGTFPAQTFLKPGQLVLPLDTHTGRISQYLGLTKRKTMNWKSALEITANLKFCDPLDPTRYDFALSRLGILSLCRRKYREEICNECQLVTVCKFATKGRKAR